MSEQGGSHWSEYLASQVPEKLGDLSTSLAQAVEVPFQIAAAEIVAWEDLQPHLEEWQGPGLLADFSVDDLTVGIALPESIGLPEWYRQPNMSQQSRLDTLGMEWALHLLPEDIISEVFKANAAEDLMRSLLDRTLPQTAQAAILTLADETPGKLLLVWPLGPAPAAIQEDAPAPVAESRVIDIPALAPSEPPRDQSGWERIRGLPIQISVRLAEKRISLGQLLAITPGALITFDKSCEDLLDMYVNNHRLCQGEAVKTGENFGLKITAMNPKTMRANRIIDS